MPKDFKPSHTLRSEKLSAKHKRPRGNRSAAAETRRREKYVAGSRRDKLAKLESITVPFSLEYYPDQFIHVPTDGKKVLSLYRKLYPGDKPGGLEVAPAQGRLKFFPPPSKYDQDPLHPPLLAARFDQIWREPDHELQILDAWDALKSAGVKFPRPDKNRSLTPGLHFGVWQRFASLPFISADTRRQEPEVIIKIDLFLGLIKKYIAPRLLDFLKDEFPNTYSQYQKARQAILTSLGAEIEARPCIDFLGAFFTVAAKEGSSEKLHIDFTDHVNGISFVIPISDGQWTGGHFCSPQLGYRIPVGRAQALAVRTRLLLHCGTPVTAGRRLVLTLFCDKSLFNGIAIND